MALAARKCEVFLYSFFPEICCFAFTVMIVLSTFEFNARMEIRYVHSDFCHVHRMFSVQFNERL
jgi:hypothetical protein